MEFTLPDGSLYYERAGAGAPVVLLHGFSFDRRMWAAPARALAAAGFQAIAYDLRGFGRSTLPAGPYAHVEDLRALLDHLGLEAAHLVGLSLGGGQAIEFALKYPERTRSLTAVDSTLGGYPWTKDWGEPGRLARSVGLAAAKAAWLADPVIAPALERPDVDGLVRQMVADYSGWHWLNRDPETGGRGPVPAYAPLGEIRAPAVIVVGETDVPDFHGVADHLARRLPRARRVELAGAGHLSSLEAPERFNAVLLDFLLQSA
ncbi:MAG: alpha/beta hydrolase [Anaerolineales bacterium]|nr:alpha/beta hydrolase [Anaerolineales bacterium]